MIQTYFIIAKLKKRFSCIDIDNKGFTMAEFLVAFAMLAVLMAGMIKLFFMLNQSYTTQNVAAGVQQVVRTGIYVMTQNIRMAGYNPLKLNGFGIQADITGSSIHFTYDLDGDGNLASTEDITYLHEDQSLKMKTRDSGPQRIIDNVTDLRFTYFDINDHVTANPAAVKTVGISMTVTEPAGRAQSLSRTYATRVICRNQGL
jgi:type IV pilus assembly protein PilW